MTHRKPGSCKTSTYEGRTAFARQAAITMPVFVANGDNDPMMITASSYLLAHHLPNAQLRVYPDAGHVNAFLGGG